MANNETFRNKFYEDYFEQQASFSGNQDIRQKFIDDKNVYRYEILPLIGNNNEISIAELGCGYGSLQQLLLENNYINSIGIDISESQAKVAKIENIKVHVQDIVMWLKEAKEEYDVVIAIDLIEHFEKPELVTLLDLIYSRLKSGGKIIFRTPNIDAPMGTTFSLGDFTHGVYLNASSARQLLLATGYKNIAIHSSYVNVGGVKELFRKCVWQCVKLCAKMQLFATGKSTKDVIFTPNMIISGER